MKRDPNGRFIKKNTIEFSIPSPVFLVKYFSILFILLFWIYLAIYKLNIGKIFEETLFFYLVNLLHVKMEELTKILIKYF